MNIEEETKKIKAQSNEKIKKAILIIIGKNKRNTARFTETILRTL